MSRNKFFQYMNYENILRNRMSKMNRFNKRFGVEFDGFIPHFFMTKPDLNIMSGSSLTSDAENIPYFKHLYSQDRRLLKELTSSSTGPFSYYLSNMLMRVPLQDISLNSVETNKTMNGWSMKYARHDIDSRSGKSLSLTFEEDKNLYTYKILKAWYLYIRGVVEGDLSPKNKYIKKKKLDYPVTVFYILTGQDGRTIRYFAHMVGLHPSSLPTSNMSGDIDMEIKTMDVPFHMFCFDDLDPFMFANVFNEQMSSSGISKIHDSENNEPGDIWVGDPRIIKENGDLKLVYGK